MELDVCPTKASVEGVNEVADKTMQLDKKSGSRAEKVFAHPSRGREWRPPIGLS